MSKLNNTHTFTAAAAFGAAAIFSMLSFGGSAEAAGNPLSCHASSAKKVLECCAVMTNTSLSKLIRTGRTCQTTYATYTPVCTNTYDCYLRRFVKLADESNGAGPSGGDGDRGHNSSNPN